VARIVPYPAWRSWSAGLKVRLSPGKPSRAETASQQPSEAASPDLLVVAHRFPAVLMLHRLAALAVTCATFPARTHEPAARPAPGSHAWIIRPDASAPAGRSRARIRRPVLAAVCTQASTGRRPAPPWGRQQRQIWRHTARRALVIFDHPYIAESAL